MNNESTWELLEINKRELTEIIIAFLNEAQETFEEHGIDGFVNHLDLYEFEEHVELWVEEFFEQLDEDDE